MIVPYLSFLSVVSPLLASGLISAAPIPMESSSHSSMMEHRNGKQPKLGLFLTDAKLDDKGAMTTADRIHGYDEAHIVLTGIRNHEAAIRDVEDWHEEMEEKNQRLGKNFPSSKRFYYKGGSPFLDEHGLPLKQDHEDLFVDSGRDPATLPPLHDLSELSSNLSVHKDNKRKAHVMQIGPAPEEEVLGTIRAAAENNIRISKLAHLLGYNTRQDMESVRSASPQTQDFAMNLARKASETAGEHVKTVFSNGFYNLGGSLGATQDYKFLEPRLPSEHIKQVGENESFYYRQLKRTKRIFQDAGLDHADYVGSDGGELTKADIWRMRKNDPAHDRKTMELREYNIAAIKHNLAQLVPGSNMHNRLSSVLRGFEEPCRGEFCDANHIALYEVAKRKKKMGFPSHDWITIDKNLRMRKAKPEVDYIHGMSPKPATVEEIQAVLDEYLPEDPAHPKSSKRSKRQQHQKRQYWQ